MPPTEETAYEKLVRTNSDYHEAVDTIFLQDFPELSEDAKGTLKAKFGAFHNNIYQQMKEAQDLIQPYFEE